MEETKAPDARPSEEWAALPWRKLERHQYHLQQRIAESLRTWRSENSSQATEIVTEVPVSPTLGRSTSDGRHNQGKKTAGIDGVKSVQPAGRLAMVEAMHPNRMDKRKPQPLRRVWIPKPGKAEQRPLGIPVMFDRACQALAKAALEPQWEAKFEANRYGFRPGRGAHDAIGAIFNGIRAKSTYVRCRYQRLLRHYRSSSARARSCTPILP
jgi:RNA-directed DNA polymerase